MLDINRAATHLQAGNVWKILKDARRQRGDAVATQIACFECRGNTGKRTREDASGLNRV